MVAFSSEQFDRATSYNIRNVRAFISPWYLIFARYNYGSERSSLLWLRFSARCTKKCVYGQGECFEEFRHAVCECRRFYTGELCESKTETCAHCYTEGMKSCQETTDSYRCNCRQSWYGRKCELKRMCSIKCKNGTCFEGQNQTSCVGSFHVNIIPKKIISSNNSLTLQTKYKMLTNSPWKHFAVFHVSYVKPTIVVVGKGVILTISSTGFCHRHQRYLIR